MQSNDTNPITYPSFLNFDVFKSPLAGGAPFKVLSTYKHDRLESAQDPMCAILTPSSFKFCKGTTSRLHGDLAVAYKSTSERNDRGGMCDKKDALPFLSRQTLCDGVDKGRRKCVSAIMDFFYGLSLACWVIEGLP